jgi:hypothetical protein
MSTTTPMSTPTSATEYLATLRDGWSQAMQQWVDQSGSAWDQWSRWAQDWAGAVPQPPGWGPGAAPRGKPGRPGHDHHHDHHHDHDHRGHRHGDCDCDCGCDCGRGREAHEGCRDACGCCVPEADVVVHARAGEVRVVPFRLSNRWRREREVTLAVGPWQVCGGRGLEVRGVLEDEKLVLAPCEDRVVRLVVSVGGRDMKSTGGTSDQGSDNNQPPAADVDQSVSAYADVRFEGCGRPVRVAVVVSPGRCDAVDVCCDCGCCC